MRWNLELVTAPVQEPLTLDEVRDHCRITTTDDDAYLDRLIVGVRQDIERTYDLALLTQSLKLRIDERWPASDWIYLPRRPLQSVTSITYTDSNGVGQTLASSIYQVVGGRTTPDLEAPSAAITLAYSQTWPSVRQIPETISIQYVAGWLARGAIPEVIRHAMLVAIETLFEHREEYVTGTIVERVPVIDALMAEYRGYREARCP